MTANAPALIVAKLLVANAASATEKQRADNHICKTIFRLQFSIYLVELVKK